MSIGPKKIGLVLLVAAAALMMGVFRPGLPQDSSEAAFTTPGGITAAPSGIAGMPGIIDQVLPAIAPASGPGSLAVVGTACDLGFCPDVEGGFPDGLNYVTFEITRVFPPGAPAATFVANGMQTLKCDDDATCDAELAVPGWVFVQLTGGGVNEVVRVTGTDESGDSRSVTVIFVETIFAVSPTNSGTAASATIVSYRCPDVGAAGMDMQDLLENIYAVYVPDFSPKDGELLYMCGGDTSSPTDDRVNFETDAGILTVEELADIALALPQASIDTGCDAGDSVDVLDSPSWVLATSASQLCDIDYAPNGVVSYGLLGTGDVGVATVTGQQSGGGGVLRTINVTFAGAAALSLFIDAPALVGVEGADFNVMIVDQDGRPIEGETVECSVSPTGGALIILPQTGTSDAAGNVAFSMIPTGASVLGGEELTINCHLDSNPDVKASATVNLTMEPTLEAVDLVEGCNPVASTWADGTAVEDVAGAVAPADALAAIWAFDTATGTWLGYSPTAPAAVSDLDSVDMLDAIFICVDAAATVSRPVI